MTFKNKANPLYADYLEIMKENISNEEKIVKIYKFTCDVNWKSTNTTNKLQ